jgi:hypothetical protein
MSASLFGIQSSDSPLSAPLLSRRRGSLAPLWRTFANGSLPAGSCHSIAPHTAAVGLRVPAATTQPLPATISAPVAGGYFRHDGRRSVAGDRGRKSAARDRPDNGPEALIRLPFEGEPTWLRDCGHLGWVPHPIQRSRSIAEFGGIKHGPACLAQLPSRSLKN